MGIMGEFIVAIVILNFLRQYLCQYVLIAYYYLLYSIIVSCRLMPELSSPSTGSSFDSISTHIY